MKPGLVIRGALAAIILSVLVYSAAWFVMASLIKKQLENLPAQAAKNGIEIDGNFSAVTGFPFAPAVSFTGSLRAPRATVVIPDLVARGFPAPGQTITFTLPQGLHLESGIDRNYVDSDLWAARFVSLTGIIPSPLPADETAEGLAEWRDSGGKIVITALRLQKETLDVRGRGVMALDSDLQPEAEVHAEIGGYESFMGWLAARNLIRRKEGFLAQAALSIFSRRDPASDKHYIAADVAVQRQGLYFGPVLLAPLPAVQWPHRK